MKKLHILLFLSLLLSSVFLQSLDEDCTATGVEGKSEYDFTDPGGPDHVLYVVICQTGDCYLPDMLKGGEILYDWVVNKNYKGTGSTVDRFVLYSNSFTDINGNAHSFPDMSKYTQVWIADLSSQLDNSAFMMTFYPTIVNWYKGRGNPHIICDGRYISSLWPNGAAKSYFTYITSGGRPERNFILNYFAGLRVRGGGLALLTDHNVFNYGINEINAGIGIDPFTGFFYALPYLMEVDKGSSLFQYPTRSYLSRTELGDTHKVIPLTLNGRDMTDAGFLIDDSSTSYAPYNAQKNGKFLYPIGWHFDQANQPGLSTTIRGQAGFLIEIVEPICKQRYLSQNDDVINFKVKVVQGGEAPISFTWTSSLDGTLLNNVDSAKANFSRSSKTLSVGTHVITVLAKDAQNLKATAKVRIIIVYNSGSDVCYAGAWNHGSDVYEIFPIKRNESGVDYFGYGRVIPDSSNTPDQLEVRRVGQYFFYESPDSIYLISIYGSGSDPVEGGTSKTNFTLDYFNNADFLLRDPQFSTSDYFYTPSTSYGVANNYFGPRTAGYVFGPFPKGQRVCINIYFDRANQDNLESIYMRSHSSPSNEVISTSPIIFFPNSILLTTSLQLCYTQCKCSDSTYHALTDSFNNHAVTFGLSGSIGNYSQGANCVYDIIPTSAESIWGISLYFGDFQFGSGDNIEIFESSSSIGTFTGSTINTINSDASTMKIIFKSDNDGVVGRGFDINYWVLPGLISVTPNKVPSQQSTKVTVSGFNFINSPRLKCQLTAKTGELVNISATYVDSKTITCSIPVRNPSLFDLNVEYNFEVSNDGIRYTLTDGTVSGRNNVTLFYFDATCSDITDCDVCIKKGTCEWCNDINNSSNSACFPRSTSGCAAANLDVDCCTKCQPLNGCSGSGACQCNNTCACNEDVFSFPPNCSCKKCPVHPNGEYCGGIDNIGRLIGTCNCNGTCECAAGFQGSNCSCIVCDGYNGKICGGHGTCGCDGNCTCDPGYVSLTETFQKCECSNVCPQDCSGHGNCSCGVCQCDEGYNLLPDCSCVESCPSDCNGNGICNCDGTCLCYDGFNGTLCDVKENCDNLTCSECQSKPYCYYCPVGNGSCYHSSDKRNSICGQNDFLKKGVSCVTYQIENAPPIISTPTFVALGVGLGLLLVGLIILAFILKKSKSKADILLHGKDPFSEGATGVNPLHIEDKQVHSNKIFEAGEDNL